MYRSSTEKNLYRGFGSVLSAFGVFAAVAFNAEKLSDSVVLTGLIVATVLAWIGVVFLHRATFGRQY